MRHWIKAVAAGACVTATGLMLAAPAAACGRVHQVRFEAGSSRVADSGSIADFLQVPVHGGRQRLIVSVAAPDMALAKSRADALAELLTAYGVDPKGIMIESYAGSRESASLLAYPPRPAEEALARGPTPPRSACG